MKRIITLVGVLCLGVCAVGQRSMTLQEMFAVADSMNATVRAADFCVQESKAGIEAARNAYLPSVQASANVSWMGLGYSFDRNLKDAQNEHLPDFGNNLAVQASQTVFAGGAVKNGVRAAQLGSELAEVRARSNRNEIRYLIVSTALETVKLQNQLRAIESNISMTDKEIEQMKSRYEEGTVLKSDITRYELLEKNLEFSKVRTESAVEIMNSRLAMAIGLSAGEKINPVIDTALPAKDAVFGAENSPLIQSAAIASSLKETELLLAKAERLPKVALFAANTFNGPDVTTFISGRMAGYGRLDRNFNFATVGVGVSYNIDNIYKSSRTIRRNELALLASRAQEDAARQNVDLARTAALTEYRNSFTQMEICEQASRLANTSYSQISDRYDDGLATIIDLLDASSGKLESEIAAINARIDVLAAYYKLQYICATL